MFLEAEFQEQEKEVLNIQKFLNSPYFREFGEYIHQIYLYLVNRILKA